MKVLITGTTQGIGRAIAVKFLDEGHTVMGIDRQEGSIDHPAYTHYVCDIRDYEHLPALDGVVDKLERGIGWYTATRAFQMRFMRLPKPQVKRGQYPA
jgi:NAD(P)-dependent dehydrogenase (short-subunit alcohol dehydrogenase family)